MEFDKSKVYTCLNGEEVVGCSGYFANNLKSLKEIVETENYEYFGTVRECVIRSNYCFSNEDYDYSLFYFVSNPTYKAKELFKSLKLMYPCELVERGVRIKFENTTTVKVVKLVEEVYNSGCDLTNVTINSDSNGVLIRYDS